MLDSITESILNTSKLATLTTNQDDESRSHSSSINKTITPPSSSLNNETLALSKFSKPLPLPVSISMQHLQPQPQPPQVSPSKPISYSTQSPTTNNKITQSKSIVQAKINHNNVMIKMHGLNNYHHQQQQQQQQHQSNHSTNTNINLFRKIAPIDSSSTSLSSNLGSTSNRPPIIVTLNSTNNLNFNHQQRSFFSNPLSSKATQPQQQQQPILILNKSINEENNGQQQQQQTQQQQH